MDLFCMGAVTCFAVLMVLPSCFCQMPQEEWSYIEYPNPLQDRDACGREWRDDNRKAYICDPNNILTENEAGQIDVMIDGVRNETDCPCSRNVCDRASSSGYRIMVALVKKIKPVGDDSAGTSHLDMNLHHAKVFAHSLMGRWKYSRCDEHVVILFSLDDNVLYSMAGKEAMIKLTPNIIAEIALNHRVHFGPGRDIFTGLQKIISDYKAVFRGDYIGMEYKTQKPIYQPVLGGASPLPALTIITTICTLLASLLL